MIKLTLFMAVYVSAAANDWEMKNTYLKSSFLQGKLDNEV
jgi:hypothetical protein